MQLQPKGLDHFEDSVKAGTALAGKRFVEAFPREARIAGNLRHALGASDVAKRFGNEGSIPAGRFEARVQL